MWKSSHCIHSPSVMFRCQKTSLQKIFNVEAQRELTHLNMSVGNHVLTLAPDASRIVWPISLTCGNMEGGEAVVCLLSTTHTIYTLKTLDPGPVVLPYVLIQLQQGKWLRCRNRLLWDFISQQPPPTRMCFVLLCSKLNILLHGGTRKQMFMEGLSFNILFNTIIKCNYLYLCKCCSLKQKINNTSLLIILFQILET